MVQDPVNLIDPNGLTPEEIQAVLNAVKDALQRLGYSKDLVKSFDENFARLKDLNFYRKCERQEDWRAATSIHAKNAYEVDIPDLPGYKLKIYDDETRGKIIAVVNPTGGSLHSLDALYFLLGFSVNDEIADKFLIDSGENLYCIPEKRLCQDK